MASVEIAWNLPYLPKLGGCHTILYAYDTELIWVPNLNINPQLVYSQASKNAYKSIQAESIFKGQLVNSVIKEFSKKV